MRLPRASASLTSGRKSVRTTCSQVSHTAAQSVRDWGTGDRKVDAAPLSAARCYVLDVPNDSIDIAFGALLVGDGWIWCDTFEFETVDTDTLTTDATDFVYPDHPLNLDFER